MFQWHILQHFHKTPILNNSLRDWKNKEILQTHLKN